MKSLIKYTFIVFTFVSQSFGLDEKNKANYDLATQFAPYKIKKLTYSTSLNLNGFKEQIIFGMNGSRQMGVLFILLTL